MNSRIFSHFSETVGDYDTVAEKVVWKNNEVHEHLVKALDFGKNEKLKFLDLGCGTGHGMSLILKEFPNSKIIGIDFSERMTEKARENLSQFEGRFELETLDFNDWEFLEGFDAVVSAIAIHNSTHEQNEKLFGKVFACLKSQGLFINGDFVEGETPEENQKFRQDYKTFLEKNLQGNELKAWLKHAFEQDNPLKLSRQFAMLEKAGFKELKQLWQFNNEALYSARK